MTSTHRDNLRLPAHGIGFRVFTVVVAIWITVVLCFSILGQVSNLPILEHTARNLYFHVPMWFVLMFGWFVAAFHSLRYLMTQRRIHDVRAEQAALVATLFGVLGITTGIVWSRFTWYTGTNIWWNGDPRQVMVAVQLLICGAYFVLRGAIENQERLRARLGAVYILFGTLTMPFLTYVLPRRMESLHPGAEGNPAFSQMDIAPEMRWVFYGSALGFLMLYWWIYSLRTRFRAVQIRAEEREIDSI